MKNLYTSDDAHNSLIDRESELDQYYKSGTIHYFTVTILFFMVKLLIAILYNQEQADLNRKDGENG